MSHPVYLSGSSLPRMPEGSRNEWRSFFGAGAELEANAFFPLFWRALFSAGDVRYGRFIDDYDCDDEASARDREECLEVFGAEAVYPYLVTDKRTAVSRLAARREALIEAIGERYRPIYEAFESLMAQRFAQHILLRTQGLPDAADAEPWLRASLAEIDQLHGSKALEVLAKDLARQDVDPFWILTGIDASTHAAWPTPALRERFPLPMPMKSRGARMPWQPRESRFDTALEWLAAFLAAGAALGVYFFTRSGWLAALAFLGAAVGLGFGLVRLRRPRPRP